MSNLKTSTEFHQRVAGQNGRELFDFDVVRETLNRLFEPGQVFEVRILECGARKQTLFGYFDHVDTAIAALQDVHTPFAGCYVTLNQLPSALLARCVNRLSIAGRGCTTSDGDIIRRRWLYVDIDPIRPSGISSTGEEHEAAETRGWKIRDFLVGLGWPEPILASSGNGCHVLFRIDVPLNDDGLIKRTLEALDCRFSDPVCKIDSSVFNASRICRLYGSRANKGDFTEDRPHRLSNLLSVPEADRVVSQTQLEALAEADRSAPGPATGSCSDHRIDLAAYVREHGFNVGPPKPWGDGGTLFPFRESPMCDHHDSAAFIAQRGNGAVVAQCLHQSCGWGWKDLRDRFPLPESVGNGFNSVLVYKPPSLPESNLGPIPASQLGAGAPVRWIWEGLVAAEHVTLLTGLWKSGKSTLLGHLLAALEKGSICITPTRPSRVLVISEESAGLWCRRRDDLTLGDHVEFILRPFKGRPSSGKWIEFIGQVAEWVRDRKFDFIVIDPWQTVNPSRDENDANAVLAALLPLHLLTDLGAGVLLIHHPRKTDAEDGTVSRGSGCLPAFCDILIELRRYRPEDKTDRRRKICGLGRFDEIPRELIIELTDSGYVTIGDAPLAAQQDRQQIIAGLLTENPLTAEDIRLAWPEGKPAPGIRTIRNDLNEGAALGLWQKSGAGTKGAPHRYGQQFDSGKVQVLYTGMESESVARPSEGDKPVIAPWWRIPGLKIRVMPPIVSGSGGSPALVAGVL